MPPDLIAASNLIRLWRCGVVALWLSYVVSASERQINWWIVYEVADDEVWRSRVAHVTTMYSHFSNISKDTFTTLGL